MYNEQPEDKMVPTENRRATPKAYDFYDFDN